jgi:hypothetical protein
VDPAALPGRAGQHGVDRVGQPAVGVGDDQLDPVQAAVAQTAQEVGPEHLVLAVTDVDPEHLPAPVGRDAGGDDDGPGDDPPVDPCLAVGGIEEHVGKRLLLQRAGPPGGDLAVELRADPGDLALADAGLHAQRRDQIVDLAGGDALHPGLHHHRVQRDVDAPARSQQRRKERSRAHFRDLHRQIPGGGRHQLLAGAVALGRPRVGPLVGCGADVCGRLGVDQRLQHRVQQPAHQLAGIGTAQCLGELKQGRLVQGHRVSPSP